MKRKTTDRLVLGVQIITFLALVVGMVQCHRMFPDWPHYDHDSDREGPGRAIP